MVKEKNLILGEQILSVKIENSRAASPFALPIDYENSTDSDRSSLLWVYICSYTFVSIFKLSMVCFKLL